MRVKFYIRDLSLMYQFLAFLHLIAAVTWLGGMLFLLMVMIPLARRNEAVGFGVLRMAAEKFVWIAWAAKIVLAGSGAYLAWEYWNVPPGYVLHRKQSLPRLPATEDGAVRHRGDSQPGPRLLAGAADDGPSRSRPLLRIAAAHRPGAPVRPMGRPHQPGAGDLGR